MRRPEHPGEVEDFTNAFLVSFGVIVFIALWAVSVILGFIWALMSAYGTDKALSRWSRRRSGL